MAKDDVWSKWLEITKKRPALGMQIIAEAAGESAVETLSELGEAAVTVMAVPLFAMSRAAHKALDGSSAVARYGIRQYRGKVSESAEKVEEAYVNIQNYNAFSEHYAEKVLKDE